MSVWLTDLNHEITFLNSAMMGYQLISTEKAPTLSRWNLGWMPCVQISGSNSDGTISGSAVGEAVAWRSDRS